MVSLLGLDISAGILVTGLLIGLTYGVLAAGLVLVFRASRVINLAHADVGAFGAALLARMVTDGGMPWLVALPLALLAGGLIGAAVEVVVVRRLAASPRVVLLVATLGVSQLLRDGMVKAGVNPTRDSFVQGIQSLGTFANAGYGPSSFRPGRTDSTDAVRVSQAFGDCMCWKPQTGFAPAAFR